MSSRRERALWIGLGVVVVIVLAWAAWPSGPPSDAARARSLAGELRCPDCESLSAADSQTASARAIRRDLRERIDQGESDASIRRSYVDRYGESILLEPSRGGLGILVWGLPLLVLGAGAIGLGATLRRGRRTEPLRASEADEAMVREARGRGEDR
ncbi:MAG: cytochrome c-type biogenesis protein CcmH [Actinomycetota bacterium]